MHARSDAGVLILLALVGCGPASPTEVKQGEAPVEAKAHAEVAAPLVATRQAEVAPSTPTTATPPPTSVATPMPSTPTTPAPAIPVASAPAVEGDRVHPPIFGAPTPVDRAAIPIVDPGWTEAMTLEQDVALERLSGGVLVRVGGSTHELGPDGSLVAEPGASSLGPRFLQGVRDIEGVWPTDAWRFFLLFERTRTEKSWLKWRGSSRWVAQPLTRTGYDVDDVAFHRWTPRGGLLLALHGGELVRLAGKHGEITPMTVDPGNAIDAFESVGGTVFMFVSYDRSEQPYALAILRSCKQDAAPGCELTGGVALPLPAGTTSANYDVGWMAARQRWSISAAIRERSAASPDPRDLLVHYETGGWKLEAVPGDDEVVHMLPARDGGLWITLADAADKETLWYRSDAGVWAGVQLPAADVDRVQVALRDDTTLWIATNSGGRHTIHATPASRTAALAPHG